MTSGSVGRLPYINTPTRKILPLSHTQPISVSTINAIDSAISHGVTPDAAATPPKAKLDEVKSLARRNNRMQREEILMTRMLLRDWYGIDHEPQLSPMSQAAIELLERAHPGAEFDHLFLEVFARHHFVISARATECLASLDLSHDALRRMCRSILEAQLVDIEEMRDLLCREYRICDLLPLTGIKGRHSGREGRGPGGHDWHR